MKWVNYQIDFQIANMIESSINNLEVGTENHVKLEKS